MGDEPKAETETAAAKEKRIFNMAAQHAVFATLGLAGVNFAQLLAISQIGVSDVYLSWAFGIFAVTMAPLIVLRLAFDERIIMRRYLKTYSAFLLASIIGTFLFILHFDGAIAVSFLVSVPIAVYIMAKVTKHISVLPSPS